jgi:hypothetical protein
MKNRVTMIVSVMALALAALPWAGGLAGAVPSARPLVSAVAPSVVSYQGQVSLGGWPFDGKGYFKFAIVDADGSTTYWCNDGSYGGGEEPEMPVELIVTDGLFNVLLGDTSVENMTEPLEAGVFADPECYLRVWFSEDGGSFQQLSPDRRIASVPYALQAERARFADYADEADDAARLDGYLPGSTSGRIPINNGVLNTNLNADMLQGLKPDNFNEEIPISNGTLNINLNADMLDGEHANDLEVPSGAMVFGIENDSRLTTAGYVDLGPSSAMPELWRSTSTSSAPDARGLHTAVWTGSEMIIWGGLDTEGITGHPLNDGARYDPATNTWTPIATTDAPEARYGHTAVWTGSEMIVWGGEGDSGYLYTGGRYNPTTDSWTSISTSNAPEGRSYHTAVWTGSDMIIWGGGPGVTHGLNTGGRYNRATDTWTDTSTTNAPEARTGHSAVWMGSQMVVWGGNRYLNNGGRYNPTTDSWTDTTTTNAPDGRSGHTAVWTGLRMIVWGGDREHVGSLNTGGCYDPIHDTWTHTSTSNAPDGRYWHTAVWTGSHMIVWGGWFGRDTGGRYHRASDTWTLITTTNAPEGRQHHTAVWADNQMVVWGGSYHNGTTIDLNSGGRYSRMHLYEKM